MVHNRSLRFYPEITSVLNLRVWVSHFPLKKLHLLQEPILLESHLWINSETAKTTIHCVTATVAVDTWTKPEHVLPTPSSWCVTSPCLNVICRSIADNWKHFLMSLMWPRELWSISFRVESTETNFTQGSCYEKRGIYIDLLKEIHKLRSTENFQIKEKQL